MVLRGQPGVGKSALLDDLVEQAHDMHVVRVIGVESEASWLPVTRTLESVFLGRVRALPEASRQLILLAAADDTGDAAVVLQAARALGIEAAALAPSEETGLPSSWCSSS
jgi:predicted ATP-dependent serine protease